MLGQIEARPGAPDASLLLCSSVLKGLCHRGSGDSRDQGTMRTLGSLSSLP